jgi:hypothetical protein
VAQAEQTERSGTGTRSASQRYSPRPLTDGERWTAEPLAKLRRRRYTPIELVTASRRAGNPSGLRGRRGITQRPTFEPLRRRECFPREAVVVGGGA